MYRGEKEEAGGLREGSLQSGSLIKIFNTSERPGFDSLKELGDETRGQQLIVPPQKEGGVERRGKLQLKAPVT